MPVTKLDKTESQLKHSLLAVLHAVWDAMEDNHPWLGTGIDMKDLLLEMFMEILNGAKPMNYSLVNTTLLEEDMDLALQLFLLPHAINNAFLDILKAGMTINIMPARPTPSRLKLKPSKLKS